jgi:hypothetical protein
MADSQGSGAHGDGSHTPRAGASGSGATQQHEQHEQTSSELSNLDETPRASQAGSLPPHSQQDQPSEHAQDQSPEHDLRSDQTEPEDLEGLGDGPLPGDIVLQTVQLWDSLRRIQRNNDAGVKYNMNTLVAA